MGRFRRSLRAKLVAATLAAALLPLALVGWLLASAAEAQLRVQALDEVRRAGDLARTVVDERGRRLQATAEAVAHAPGIRGAALIGDRKSLVELAATFADGQGATVAVASADGAILARSYAPDQHGDNVAGVLAGLRRAMDGEPGYTIEAAGLRGLALRGFAPIRTTGGRVVGVVLVTQNVDRELVGSLRDLTGFDAFALLPDGSVVGADLEPGLVAGIRTGRESVLEIGRVDGRERAVYAWPLGGQGEPAGAALGFVLPLDGLEAAQARFRRTALATGLLAAVGSLALAWLLSRALVAPLERIAVAARKIARGEEGRIPQVGSGDELDDLSGALGAMLDGQRTARAAAERAAAERAAILGQLTEGVVITDPEGRITFVNDAARELHGTADLGVPVADYSEAYHLFTVDGEPYPSEELPLARAVTRGEVVKDAQWRILRPDGTEVVAQGSARPVLAEDGRRLGAVLSLRDVTQEREVQRLKDELVSVVSHELRTPLASVVGFAELLLTREFTPAEQREFLTIMLEEGRRLTALINDFLDLQRLESGRQQINPVPLDLPQLLRRAVQAAGEDSERPIELDVPAGLPPVLADPDRILQVLGNLLGNARKYSPEGGTIRLSAEQVDGAVRVAVSDRGLGIPPEALPQLFEKFYRVDNSDRREIKGTGLGLAICQHIISAHGGRIWASSAGLGGGATLAFTLPVAVAAADERADVLIVEDDLGFSRLMEAELAGVGLTSTRVGGVAEALARLAAWRPRAVVLDLLLPELRGEELLERLAAAKEATPPVVVVSVRDLGPDERAALGRRGVVAVFRKGPGVAAEAADAIERMLGGRTADLPPHAVRA